MYYLNIQKEVFSCKSIYSDCVTKPFCTQGLTQIQTDDDGPC